jgi:hypothetical protein
VRTSGDIDTLGDRFNAAAHLALGRNRIDREEARLVQRQISQRFVELLLELLLPVGL